MTAVEFDVALSFAGEDRPIAEQLFAVLTARGFSVFYDRAYEAEGWGRDLSEVLGETYGGRARHCLMLVSRHYVSRGYPLLEKRHAQAHHLRNPNGDYILQVRLDGTPAPGIPETMWWVPFRSVDDVANLVERKLGCPRGVAHAVEALVAALRTRSREAIHVVLSRTIAPLQGLPSLGTALARNVARITAACAEGECEHHDLVASVLTGSPGLAQALMDLYPELDACAATILRDCGGPAVDEFFRAIVRKGAGTPHFSAAWSHVQARLWQDGELPEDDEAAVIDAYRATPAVGYIMLELLAHHTPRMAAALQEHIEHGPEADRALMLMFAHERHAGTFVPVLQRMLQHGCSEGVVLGYLAEAGVAAALARQQELERELRATFRGEDAAVVEAVVFLRTCGQNVVRRRRDRLQQAGEFDELMTKAVAVDPSLSPAWARVLDFLAPSRPSPLTPAA